ncbi:transcription factor GAMYB-like [Olea europaea subsp. europaea]|uniref:Transcription factor GAMYB-like n=1 Tax=Olea europaea subsp. europaea TaxID=158383 RepID=A0A8S0SVL1_OLEEU|nr:transcription factor GAMYB-like [Olea europaea subsp. europaea]
MSSESEEKMISKDSVDLTCIEEDTSGGNVGGNGPLKKGPWTSAKDAILIEYITKHGEGTGMQSGSTRGWPGVEKVVA